MKRGQVTIFVLLAIFILLIVTIIFFLRNNILNNGLQPIISTSDQEYFDGFDEIFRICYEDSFLDSVFKFGREGGLYNPENYSFYGVDKIPHYNLIYKLNIKDNPNYYQEQIKKIYNEEFDFCISNSLEAYNSSITKDVEIEFNKNNIKLISNLVVVRSNIDRSRILRIQESTSTIKYDLLDITNKLNEFFSILSDSKDFVPLSDILEFSDENEIEISILNINQNTVLYTLKFDDLNKKEFIFNSIWEYPNIEVLK
tara:strand:+ start:126 stop:893 length:768 start_codon:yes stop_codon:yes gene_type:complete